jgi:hypothetical protein
VVLRQPGGFVLGYTAEIAVSDVFPLRDSKNLSKYV